MADITAIILTKNEEKNLAGCISSIKDFARRIVVIDSGSTDQTLKIAKALNVDVYEHKFENYSKQFNWGIDNINITTKWILRLDADERFTPALCEELEVKMLDNEETDVNGFVLEAWLFFMDKCLKYGGSRKKKLMVFKNGLGRIENRKMDEHTILSEGRSWEIKEKFLHYDYKDLTTYVKKLNWYATREMQDYFEDAFPNEKLQTPNKKIRQTRIYKTKYYKFPLFWRCWMNFFYAYFIRGNFLNGKEGFVYSFLYHLFYRMLVDAKIYEQRKLPKAFEITGDLK